MLDDEAKSYEDAADPALAAKSGDRRVNLTRAEKTLAQAVAKLERLLKEDPANDVSKAFLGHMQVRISVIRRILHTPGTSDEPSRRGLAALKEVAEKDQASPMVPDQAATAFLTVEPAPLRDPQFAIRCAEREVAMSHGQLPSRLLTLAQAYRASGQMEKSMKANIRKLLENEAQTRF